MGETKTPHFYDFGILGRVPGSQNQLFSFEAPGHRNKIKQIPGTFLKHINLININVLAIRIFDNFRKGGHRQITMIRLIRS